MTNEFSQNFIKAKFEAFARKQLSDTSKLFSYLNLKTNKINDHEYIAGRHSVQSIRNLFNAAEEKVFIRDFENGLRKDLSDTLLESIVSIGRNQIILDMLEQNNPESLIESFKKSPISMFELNGKYYLENDGNHRLMALKALYYLEKSKNLTHAELEKLDEKYSFSAPVKHLNHSAELLDLASKLANRQKQSRFFDYLSAKRTHADSIYNFLTYEKLLNRYNIDFQGQKFDNQTKKQTMEILTELLNYDKPYSIYKQQNGYALEFGNTLFDDLTAENLNSLITNLKTNKTEFSNEYKIIKKQNCYDLIIDEKRYTGNKEELTKIYSLAAAFNQNKQLHEMEKVTFECEILSEEEISKQYFKNLDYIDIELKDANSFVKINQRNFENISKEELKARLNQLSKERMFCEPDMFTLRHEQRKEEKYL